MADDTVDKALQSVDPKKRTFVKQLVIGTAFAVPAVASYSVRDLAVAQVGSPSGTVLCLTSLIVSTTTILPTPIPTTPFTATISFTTFTLTSCFTTT